MLQSLGKLNVCCHMIYFRDRRVMGNAAPLLRRARLRRQTHGRAVHDPFGSWNSAVEIRQAILVPADNGEGPACH
jgi:hypothetical protein